MELGGNIKHWPVTRHTPVTLEHWTLNVIPRSLTVTRITAYVFKYQIFNWTVLSWMDLSRQANSRLSLLFQFSDYLPLLIKLQLSKSTTGILWYLCFATVVTQMGTLGRASPQRQVYVDTRISGPYGPSILALAEDTYERMNRLNLEGGDTGQ